MQTQCPHCHTLFRITEAQLAMADGRVRCGFCKEVFDAGIEIDVNDDGMFPTESLANDQRTGTGGERTPDHAFLSGDTGGTRSGDIPGETITGQVSNIATAAWSLAILALIAALAIEITWFNRPQLLQTPTLKPLADKLCELTACEHMQLRDPAQIEMISRNVYTHPNAKNALMISTTLVNHADYAQPYPDVQIDFSNVRGELVASRRFAPEEYLQPDNEKPELMQSGNPVTFGLEISDPGQEAITYEFSFH
jgi:predicted Zn finger-like uncharacterized protein